MAAMQTPDGMTYVARPRKGGGTEDVERPADGSHLRPEG
jgi:hypothetical protein